MSGIDNFPVQVYPVAGTQFEDQWQMARSPVNFEDLDVEQLGDQELHAVMSRIQGALHGRFSTRTEEFRELAREMGFVVTLTNWGGSQSAGVHGLLRKMTGGVGSARNTATLTI